MSRSKWRLALTLVDALVYDVRYGARMLRKTRGLTLIAMVSLAAGIGGNAAIFSILNAILFRPRAVAQPDQLVALYAGDRQHPYQTVSYPSYLELRERNGVFSGLAAYGVGWQFHVGGANEVEPVWGEVVSGNYFEVLGVAFHQGRGFLPDEDLVPNRNPVAVIGYGLWQRKFGANPAAIGSTITVNGQPLTIVGIAPREYAGMMSGWASEIWVPAMMTPLLSPSLGERRITSRGAKWLTLIGRLKPGVTIDQARSRFALLSKEMQAAHPEEWTDRRDDDASVRESFISVLSERETRVHPAMRGPAYALAALLFVIVDLVLVIACMNLAGTLFARGVARRHEIAVRLAIGASRGRILRQLLTESLMLAFGAGAAGVVLAIWGLDALLASLPALPEGIRIAADLQLDWRVLLYAIAFATLTGVLFGLAPALQASRAAVSSVLKDDAAATGWRRARLRQSLVLVQVALSLVLLITAGLVLRSLGNVTPTRLGFTTENLLVAPVRLEEPRYDRRAAHRFYQDLTAITAALPGVEAVSLVEGMPGGFMSRTRRSTEIEGYSARAGESLELDAAIVGPDYFTNMRVPLVAGRDIGPLDRDGSPCVAVVNVVFAQRYLGGVSSALGRHLARYVGPSRAQKEMCEIVGVVRDQEWQSLNREVLPFYALPLLQSGPRRMTLLVNSVGDPGSLASAVRQTILRLDPNLPVTDLQTLGDYFRVALYPFRVLALVMAACGMLALLLAMLGIYGIVAYSVAQRRREIGIRMALGALDRDILRLVVRQGMLPVSVGLSVGLVLAAALTRVLTSLPLDTQLLFGLTATDPWTFTSVPALLALVALAACYVPARRAARWNPMTTLRDA